MSAQDMSAQDPTHNFSPEVLAWLAAQRSAGFEPALIFQALREAGWEDADARVLMGWPAVVEPRPSAEAAGLPAQPMPWPPLAGERVALPAGDRSVNAVVVMHEPELLVLEGLLSDEECAALIDAARPRLTRSLTVEVTTGGEEENADRTSQGMFFERAESALIERIEQRIAALLNWPVQNGEGLQVLRYGPGAEYKPHYDYFDPAETGTASILARGGQRVGTLVMYLHEPEAGGSTVFPDVQFECLPKRGNAVFFNYNRPHPATRTLHGGMPVLQGEKWIATKWLREREFT